MLMAIHYVIFAFFKRDKLFRYISQLQTLLKQYSNHIKKDLSFLILENLCSTVYFPPCLLVENTKDQDV